MSLTKEKIIEDLEEMEAIYYNCDTSYPAMKMFKKSLENMYKLVDKHFETLKENERLQSQLLEYQIVCKQKQEIIDELSRVSTKSRLKEGEG